MKITELRAENVKRLSAVEITPEGSVIVVGGKNGAGKSSVLDSIVYALNGAKSLPGKPVRKGEEKAEIEITLDGDPKLVIRRRIREDGKTDLEIKQVADGRTSKIDSPQKLLDTLCGTVAFDPLAFTKLKRQEQADMLRRLVGVDVADLDAEEKRLFDERTEVNRDVKRLDAQLAGMPPCPNAPDAELSAKDVLAEMEEVRQYNESCRSLNRALDDAVRALERQRDEWTTCATEVARIKAELEEAEREEATAKAGMVTRDAEIMRAKKAAEDAIEKDDAPLVAKLESIESINAEVRANSARAAIVEQAAAATEQADDLTRQIEDCRDERLNRLAAAKWPVEGLAFGDDGVTFNSLPFDQCSSAEQLRISTAIGLAQHPQLRVLLIRDGSLLDADSLAAIAKLAEEHDGQVWLERVSEGEECSVIISDGAVAGAAKKQKELVA